MVQGVCFKSEEKSLEWNPSSDVCKRMLEEEVEENIVRRFRGNSWKRRC